MRSVSEGSPITTRAVVVGMSGATGLAVVRALAHGGVACHALHDDAAGPGLTSRFAQPHICPSWRADPVAFVSFLLDLAARELGGEPASLFVVDDAAVEVVWSAVARLRAAGLRPAFTFAGSPVEVLDKRTQMAAASRAGADFPASEWGSAEELLAQVTSFRFPVIVKPALSHLGVRRIGAKALRCATATELSGALERTRGLDVLVQEFVPGGDDQLYTCGLFRGGSRTLVFTGRKLKQHPPVLGVARLCEAIALPELIPGSVRLLDELGFEGIAQVEYKRDDRDGAYRLMEVNVRPWIWIGLAEVCGVNLPLAAHEWALGQDEATESSPGAGAVTALEQTDGRWISTLPEAMHTASDIARGRWPDPRQWRGLKAEAFFARDDPRPFLAELQAPLRLRVARLRRLWTEVKRGILRALRGPAFAVNLASGAGEELRAARGSSGRPRPALGLPAGDRVLVLAPHPDDETIMCGATLAASRRRGDAVRVIAVTSGGATDQGRAGGDVAEARRGELNSAAAVLGVDDVVFWGLADRGLTAARGQLAGLIGQALDEYAPTDVYVPFPNDSHGDHVATALALADALVARSARQSAAGLRMHCGFVSTVPDAGWVDRVVPATRGDWRARRTAIAAYKSRDASIFVKPQQFALLASGYLLRPVERFVDLDAAEFAAVAKSLADAGLTRPIGGVSSHPLYMLLERSRSRRQRALIAAVLAERRQAVPRF